jgi:choline-sulfatase
MPITRRPNIVLFLTDDHGAWALGAAGNREVQSPTLDSLAAAGTRFSNAFTPSPVCSPARGCLMTGRTPSQVGIHDWLEEAVPPIAQRDWLADEFTLPMALHQAGYFCGLSGKWHLGKSHESPRGFDWCFGMPGGQGIHIQEYTYHLNGQPTALTGNKTKILTDRAIEFLHLAPADQPFFLNVGYIATHSPYANQEPQLVDLYRNASFADIPPYNPHIWRKNEGFVNDLDFDPNDRRDACMNYYAAVTDIDRNVARLLEALRATGHADDTIVIYVADHGLTLGHHGFWGKGNSTRPLNMYETSLRVPMIWHGPGIARGQVIDHCVDHYDTFLSLLQTAGATLDESRNYPGESYARALGGNDLKPWRETRFGEYGDLRMIRTPAWKLVIRYPEGPHDLFDLANDPGETKNVFGLAGNEAIEHSLRSELEAFYAKYQEPTKTGLAVKALPQHNASSEAWRDGIRESRGLQVY